MQLYQRGSSPDHVLRTNKNLSTQQDQRVPLRDDGAEQRWQESLVHRSHEVPLCFDIVTGGTGLSNFTLTRQIMYHSFVSDTR